MVKHFSSEHTITIRSNDIFIFFEGISKFVGQNATLVLGQNIGRPIMVGNNLEMKLPLWLHLLFVEFRYSGIHCIKLNIPKWMCHDWLTCLHLLTWNQIRS